MRRIEVGNQVTALCVEGQPLPPEFYGRVLTCNLGCVLSAFAAVGVDPPPTLAEKAIAGVPLDVRVQRAAQLDSATLTFDVSSRGPR